MWLAFRKALINFLKGAAVKAVLIKFFQTSVGLGIKGWIVKYIVEQLFDSIAVPTILLTYRKGELYYDHAKGKLQIKRLNNTQDVDSYNDILDRILSVDKADRSKADKL